MACELRKGWSGRLQNDTDVEVSRLDLTTSAPDFLHLGLPWHQRRLRWWVHVECMEGVMSYEYLWISDHSVTIQWPFSDHLVTIQWPFSDHLVTIQWSQCSVVISETVRLKRFATRLLFDKLQRRRVQNDWLELMEYGKTMMTHHESLLFICEDKAMMNTQLIDGQY